jgi:hypothetical protein
VLAGIVADATAAAAGAAGGGQSCCCVIQVVQAILAGHPGRFGSVSGEALQRKQQLKRLRCGNGFGKRSRRTPKGTVSSFLHPNGTFREAAVSPRRQNGSKTLWLSGLLIVLNSPKANPKRITVCLRFGELVSSKLGCRESITNFTLKQAAHRDKFVTKSDSLCFFEITQSFKFPKC